MKWMLTLAALFAGPLSACCMVPKDFAGDVDQSAQRVVIVHREKTADAPGYQEMLIQVRPFFQGSDANPAYMAWVITLPSKPLRYDVADTAAMQAGSDTHERLFALARQQWADKTDLKWPDWLPTAMLAGRDDVASKADSGVIEDPTVAVGPYVITPVRASGLDGVKALNEYLGERGFPGEDVEHLNYFVENDFTFLCIRVEPVAGNSTLGRELKLPPLVVGFETEDPYYPAKFSSRQGNFALDLTVITDQTLDTEGFGEMRRRLKAESRGYVQLINLYTLQPLPEALTGALSERAMQDKPARWYVNRIQSKGFNGKGDDSISRWKDDVFFKGGAPTDELPGFWYYGDQDVTFAERFFREHALAFMFTGGFLLFATLFLKTRMNRRRHQAEKANATA